MAKHIEIKCSYCDAKESFNEYKEAPYHGWMIFGWMLQNNIPYAKCPKCSKGEEPVVEEKKKRKKKL